MINSKRKVIAIVGPTASGKTGLGVKIAREFNGEIVSADSRQVFCGLDIGSGKDLNEYGDVPYHLIDVCKPGEEFHLFKYLEMARAAIEDIFNRGKVPIIVGGTGLYIQGIVEGFQLEPSIKYKVESRKFDRKFLDHLDVGELSNILKKLDIEAYEGLADQKNPHRLIRAIERVEQGLIQKKKKPDFDVLQIGVSWPREILNNRIDKRVEERFDQGMLLEVYSLLKSGVKSSWLRSLGLEYRIISEFLLKNDGKTVEEMKSSKDFAEMKENLKTKIHQFEKRQMTWFKRFPEIVWENDLDVIKKVVREYLKGSKV